MKLARVTRYWTYGDFDIKHFDTRNGFSFQVGGMRFYRFSRPLLLSPGSSPLSRCWSLSSPARWNMPTHANCRITSRQQRLKTDVSNTPFIAKVHQSWFVNECRWSGPVCFSVLFDTRWFVCTTINIFVPPKTKQIFYYTPISLYRPLSTTASVPKLAVVGKF